MWCACLCSRKPEAQLLAGPPAYAGSSTSPHGKAGTFLLHPASTLQLSGCAPQTPNFQPPASPSLTSATSCLASQSNPASASSSPAAATRLQPRQLCVWPVWCRQQLGQGPLHRGRRADRLRAGRRAQGGRGLRLPAGCVHGGGVGEGSMPLHTRSMCDMWELCDVSPPPPPPP